MNLARVAQLVGWLGLPSGDFALHGSAPLLAHGLIAEINDLDIVARGEAWTRALELGARKRGREDDVIRPHQDVEIFNGWLGDDADALIDSAEDIAGLPCVTLLAVLDFKRRLGRPKDLQHIRLIEEYLASGR